MAFDFGLLDKRQPCIQIKMMISRQTRKGNGLAVMRELLEEAHARGYTVCAMSPLTTKGNGLMKKLKRAYACYKEHGGYFFYPPASTSTLVLCTAYTTVRVYLLNRGRKRDVNCIYSD